MNLAIHKKNTPVKHTTSHRPSSGHKTVNKKKVEGSGKVLVTKKTLVINFLKRWWYAIEDWPPRNYDYS